MIRKLDGTIPGGLDKMDTSYATSIKKILDRDLHPSDYWPADFRKLRKQDYYQYLDEVNRGKVNGGNYRNKRYYTASENNHLPEAVADSLHLSAAQKNTAVNSFKSLGFEKLGLSKVVLAYCTCAYVTHRDAEFRKCHPQTKEDDMDRHFERVRKSLEISQQEFTKTYGKVQNRLRSK